MPRVQPDDLRFMLRAIALARRGEGLTRPNPPVGAVVVRDGRIVGEGWHRKAGGPHAEVHALRAAGEKARGATVYVTLEPCSTHGRTPPCTGALIAAGVKRVVVASLDPNPKHAGRGLTLLRKAGIAVTTGVAEAEACALIEPFSKWILTKRPWVTLKLGMTLDGRIADAAGRSRWITSPASRREVQNLRRRADAILIGRETARADDPSLLPVPPRGRKPWRVVVDTNGSLPATLRVFTDEANERTLLATTRGEPSATRLVLPASKGHVSLRALLRELGRRGLLHVVCEGGGELASALWRDGLVDEAWLFLAPKLLGGSARPAFGGTGWPLARAPELEVREVRRVGPDTLIVARPKKG